MTTTGFAERARRFLDRGGEKSEISQTDGFGTVHSDSLPQCEKSELGELSPIGPYAPLDTVIAESEAGRRSLADIEGRLTRLTATAARPEATPLDRQLVRDWTAIRDAKLAGRVAA